MGRMAGIKSPKKPKRFWREESSYRGTALGRLDSCMDALENQREEEAVGT